MDQALSLLLVFWSFGLFSLQSFSHPGRVLSHGDAKLTVPTVVLSFFLEDEPALDIKVLPKIGASGVTGELQFQFHRLSRSRTQPDLLPGAQDLALHPEGGIPPIGLPGSPEDLPHRDQPDGAAIDENHQ